MSLRLYDTATREVRDFDPLVPGEVSIYHCGLTVQSAPHVGHIRKEVVFDVLRRWLTWQGLHVTVIANVTDIDDKILNKSAEAGVPWFAHAYRFERELHDAYAALGLPAADVRATGDRARAGDARADRDADRARARVRGGGRLRRRLLRRPVLAGLRRALPAADRGHGAGRGRGSARQARPARLRPVEGPQALRADHARPGRHRGVAGAPAGTWSARRWPGSTSATSSTSTAAVWTCGSRTTRTSWPSRRRPASASPGSGCTTPGSPRPGRR